jgi:peptidoglycan/LPS O-acetylase OafA/YrhL
MSQIKQLTSLRGLAAWWVVFYHFRDATTLPIDNPIYKALGLGYLAVDFFFVLSGFIIYLNYRNSFKVFSLENYKFFLINRLARIYPLHVFIMVLFLLNPIFIYFFSKSLDFGSRYSGTYYIFSIFLVQNWGWTNELEWNIPAWSISTELGAYIIFPAIAKIQYRLNRKTWSNWIALLFLSAIIFYIYKNLEYKSIGQGISKVGLLRCILEFCMGTCVANIYMNYRLLAHSPRWTGVAAVTLASVSILFGLRDYLLCPLIFSLLVLYIASNGNLTRSLLENKFILFLGEISYSTYLIHYLIKDWVKFISLDIGLIQFFFYSCLVGVLSAFLYYCVEKPGRSWVKNRWANSHSNFN